MASDNAAGVHPAILEALASANSFHALGYGHDQFTPLAKSLFNQLFGAEVTTEFVFGGTGANVLALACMLKPAQAVVCTSTGAKLIDIPTVDGKLRPSDIRDVAHLRGSIHHAEPAVVSITQATEMGTIYTADEVRQICITAHDLGMLVHMDGARITNAAVALGGTAKALRSFTIDAGVDVLSFGGVKAGLMFGESVVFSTRVSPHASNTSASKLDNSIQKCDLFRRNMLSFCKMICYSNLLRMQIRWHSPYMRKLVTISRSD
jgi:threonine aldolase